jgi:gluconate 5-dehydrogenase
VGLWDQFRLDGRRAVVTGGSRGLGRVMAGALAEAGADLVIVGRDPQSLETARSELAALGRRVDVVVADMGTPEGAGAACAEILNRFGPVEVLISNVGGRRIPTPTEELSLADWQRIIDLNLTGTLVCCQKFGAGMLERGSGSIIVVSSIAAMVVTKGIGGRAYEVAKAAVSMLVKTLAADWAARGVRVNAIAPGGFLTAPNRRWFGERPDFRTTFEGMIPMGRLGEPEEIGPLAVYLASNASSYMTGSVVVIDGGYTLW